MNLTDADKVSWPTVVGINDSLWLGVDLGGVISYLVFDSHEKQASYIRSNKAWFRVPADNDYITIHDLTAVDVPVSIIPFYDKKEASGAEFTFQDLMNFDSSTSRAKR